MKKVILTSLALSAILAHSALANNLGVLGDEQKPQHLVPATELIKHLSANEAVAETPATNSDHGVADRHGDCDDFGFGFDGLGFGFGSGFGFGGLGFGRWWGGYGYWPYFSSYWPYYYGYGYWWSNENTGNHERPVVANAEARPTDRAHTPVVCFASDANGNWFGNVDIAQNAVAVQQASNHECLGGGGSCTQNLGCALAFDNNQQ